MILHTLNASPASAALRDCLAVVQAGDALLLLGDGVYAAMAGTDTSARLNASGAEVYVLEPDAMAAGILDRIAAANVVDMNGFVELSERFPRQQAWY